MTSRIWVDGNKKETTAVECSYLSWVKSGKKVRDPPDSSPHFCDNKTDLIRIASQNTRHGIRFGTHAFPARHWLPFSVRYSYRVRLYLLYVL